MLEVKVWSTNGGETPLAVKRKSWSDLSSLKRKVKGNI